MKSVFFMRGLQIHGTVAKDQRSFAAGGGLQIHCTVAKDRRSFAAGIHGTG
jgi:hypothetical protein